MALIALAAALLVACSSGDRPADTTLDEGEAARPRPQEPATGGADVLAVVIEGEPGGYRFTVTVRSPDTGCDSYADWWEVVGAGGDLRYRRILLHSHVDEQPFVRGGSPVEIGPGEIVIVRAHMSTSGYGGSVLRGSVEDGFQVAAPAAGFAVDLATTSPLPDGCAF